MGNQPLVDGSAWPEIGFRPRRLGHVNLFVASVERSFPFYSEVCGLEKVFEEPQIFAVFLGNGNTHHDIAIMGVAPQPRIGRDGHVQVSKGRGVNAGLNHLGFEMETEADLVAAIQRAQEQGFELNRIVDHQISHSAYLFDPDGNYVEIYADVAHDWRRIYNESEGQLITGTWTPSEAPPSQEPRYDSDPDIHVNADALLHPTRVARATLVVEDLSRSRSFYERVVGLRETGRYPEPGELVLGATLGRPDLTLVQRGDGDALGLHHFTFELPSMADYDEGVARLRASGVAIEQTSGPTSEPSVLVRDPDGLLVEFVVPYTA